jgi:hypothetical protein
MKNIEKLNEAKAIAKQWYENQFMVTEFPDVKYLISVSVTREHYDYAIKDSANWEIEKATPY